MESKETSDENLPKMVKVKSVSPKPGEGGLTFKDRKFSDPNIKILRNPKKKKSILKTGSRLKQKENSPDSDKEKPQQSGVTWDTKEIDDEQSNYRKLHPGKDKKKIKSETNTKYKTVENMEDSYSKAFNNVIKMKVTDDILKKVLGVLNEPKNNLPRNKTSKSPLSSNKIGLEEIYSLTEKDKVFGNDLEKENIRTLQNTLLNKFHKEITSNNAN